VTKDAINVNPPHTAAKNLYNACEFKEKKGSVKKKICSNRQPCLRDCKRRSNSGKASETLTSSTLRLGVQKTTY